MAETQEGNLLALERLLRIRWDLEVVSRLWSLGYRSASQIANRLRADVVTQLTPVGGAAIANEVFESAASIVGKVIDGVRFGQALQASGVEDHVANATDIGQYFDAVTGQLGQLPRPVSLEACKSCNSVLGPAAYLLDLLSFLQEATVQSITPSPEQPSSLVLAGPFAIRRPNVYTQPLDCDSVNSPVPLVQILNEEIVRVLGPANVPVPMRSVSRWPWNAAPSESATRMKAWESALLFRVADAVSLRATSMFIEDTTHPVSLGYSGDFMANAAWQQDRWRLLETRLGLHFPVVSLFDDGHAWIQPGIADILPPDLVRLDTEVLSHDLLILHVFGYSHTEKHRIAELHTFRRASGLATEQVQELLQLPAFAATDDHAALQLVRVRGDFAIASDDDVREFDIAVMQRPEELPVTPAIDALSDTDILNLYRFVTLHHATKLSFGNLGAALYWTGLLDSSEHAWTPTALHGLATLLSISDALQTSVDVVATWFSPDLTAIPAIGKANAESGLTRWQEVFGTLDPGTDSTKDSVLNLTPMLKTSLGLSHAECTAFFHFIASPEGQSRRSVLQTAYRFASLARSLRLPLGELLAWVDETESPLFALWVTNSVLDASETPSPTVLAAERIITTEFALQRLNSLRSHVSNTIDEFRLIVYGTHPPRKATEASEFETRFDADVLAWLQASPSVVAPTTPSDEVQEAYATTFEAVVQRHYDAAIGGTAHLVRSEVLVDSEGSEPESEWRFTLPWLKDFITGLSVDSDFADKYASSAGIFRNAALTMYRLALVRDVFGLSQDELQFFGTTSDEPDHGLPECLRGTLPLMFQLPAKGDLDTQTERGLTTAWHRFGALMSLRDAELERRDRLAMTSSALDVTVSLFNYAEGSAPALAEMLGLEPADLPVLATAPVADPLPDPPPEPLPAPQYTAWTAQYVARQAVVLRIARAGAVFAPRRVSAAVVWKQLSLVPSSHTEAMEIVTGFENALSCTLSGSTMAQLTRQVNQAVLGVTRDILMAMVRGAAHNSTSIWFDIRRAADPALYVYNRLFIDPLMSPEIKTTRVVEATLAIQTMVNRAVLGHLDLGTFEAPNPVSLVSEHVKLWEWLKRYRQWEAARKLVLWPENWLRAELRDDQTDLFRQFRDSLGSGAVPLDAARSAYLHYLRELERISHMQPVAVSWTQLESADGSSRRTATVLAVRQDRPNQLYWTQRTETRTTKMVISSWLPWGDMRAEMQGRHLSLVDYEGTTHLFAVRFERAPSSPKGFDTGTAGMSRWEAASFALHQAESENTYIAKLSHAKLTNSKWTQLEELHDLQGSVRVPVAELYDGERLILNRPHRPRDPSTFVLLASTPSTPNGSHIEISVFYRRQSVSDQWTSDFALELSAEAGFIPAPPLPYPGFYLRHPLEVARFQYAVRSDIASSARLNVASASYAHVRLPNAVRVDGQRLQLVPDDLSEPTAESNDVLELRVFDWTLGILHPDRIRPAFAAASKLLYSRESDAPVVLASKLPLTLVCPSDAYFPRAGSSFIIHDRVNHHAYLCIPSPRREIMLWPPGSLSPAFDGMRTLASFSPDKPTNSYGLAELPTSPTPQLQPPDPIPQPPTALPTGIDVNLNGGERPPGSGLHGSITGTFRPFG